VRSSRAAAAVAAADYACVPLLTIACTARCCSEDRGPTRNLLTSQFLTPAELKQMLQHCHSRGDRQGLMLAAMLALGVYNGFRSVGCSTGPRVQSLVSSGPATDMPWLLQGRRPVHVHLWAAGVQHLQCAAL
jgi:hypothetical protein